MKDGAQTLEWRVGGVLDSNLQQREWGGNWRRRGES